MVIPQHYPKVLTGVSSLQFESVLLTLVNKGIILYMVSSTRGTLSGQTGRERKACGAALWRSERAPQRTSLPEVERTYAAVYSSIIGKELI